MTFTTGAGTSKISAKWFIVLGETLVFIATLLLPFSCRENRYWPIVFPSFMIGSAGMMLVFMHSK